MHILKIVEIEKRYIVKNIFSKIQTYYHKWCMPFFVVDKSKCRVSWNDATEPKLEHTKEN